MGFGIFEAGILLTGAARLSVFSKPFGTFPTVLAVGAFAAEVAAPEAVVGAAALLSLLAT